jgi:polyhydroxybutyrate depolymerase
MRVSLAILFSVVMLFSLQACKSEQKAEQTPDKKNELSSYQTGLITNQSITVDGQSRKFHYYMPTGTSTSLPLVILLHGHGVSIDSMTGGNGSKAPYKVWMELAEKDKFIAIYPQGLDGTDGKSGWNDCRGDNTEVTTADDVKFINSLISLTLYPADSHRVYVVGSSNGGMMALRMALDSPGTVAGIGAVIASMPAVTECATPTEATAILFINGTSDTLVPYAGGNLDTGKGSVRSVPDSIQFWISNNSTSSTPSSTTNIPDSNTSDSSTVTFSTYLGGTNGTAVFEYKVIGGGHLEPSIKEQYSSIVELVLGKQNHDMEMAEVIWSFLKGRTK